VPAPAVIPAPRVYTKAVAVKTLVVEPLHSTYPLGFPSSLRKGGGVLGDLGGNEGGSMGPSF